MKSKQAQVIFAIIFVFIIALCFIFVGQVKYEIIENEIKFSGTLTKSTTIKFNGIQSIEYIENLMIGTRDIGLGTLKMQIGSYNNEEYDKYKLYAYASVEQYIVIKYNDKVLVFNQSTIESTKSIYNTLKSQLEKVQ